MKSFASDNYASIHPRFLQAIVDANQGHAVAYGDDEWTKKAVSKFQEYFGPDCDVYFVFNGTGANVLGIQTLIQSFHGVICAESAHINTNECGAIENLTGCKLFTVPTTDGKLKVDMLNRYLHVLGDMHQAQPKVISITQVTEYGTIYSLEEIKNIVDFAHARGLYVHIDGARIANAAVKLGVSFKQMTVDLGVDVLSFGGTKNGLMCGEAVIFFNPKLSTDFKFRRKQGMQLASKMRYISAQYIALLSDDLWKKNAEHSNQMAQKLASTLRQIPEIKITQNVDSNAVFAILPKKHIAALQKHTPFYVWNEDKSEVRFMTSFDTTDEDIDQFVEMVKREISK